MLLLFVAISLAIVGLMPQKVSRHTTTEEDFAYAIMRLSKGGARYLSRQHTWVAERKHARQFASVHEARKWIVRKDEEYIIVLTK